MKNLLLIAAILGFAYWYTRRLNLSKAAATQQAEPSLKSAWLLSSTATTKQPTTPTTTTDSSTPDSSSGSSSETGGYVGDSGNGSEQNNGNTDGMAEAAYFTRSGNSKSCFR